MGVRADTIDSAFTAGLERVEKVGLEPGSSDGTSILALELCGKQYHRSATSLKAGAFILKNDLSRSRPHYSYGIYYCSQAMFQLGDNYWNSFRTKLHDQLLPNQNTNGSWSGRVSDDYTYGPNYCTSMAVLALTVERYRRLGSGDRKEKTRGGNQ